MKKLFICLLLCLSLAPLAPAEELPAILQEGGILFLVNRQHRASADYEPQDLVKPRVDTRKKSLQERIYMREEAALALESMFTAAFQEAGLKLLAVSGYRSYGSQQVLFNQKAADVGASTASLTVARAGESEHQLGLTIDIQCPSDLNLNAAFAQTPEGQWVGENAHRFGFIIRYRREWEDLTGYKYEPWHLRYLGIAHATAVYWLNVAYETYYEQMIRLPAYAITRGNSYLLYGAVNDLLNGNEEILSLLPANAADPDAALAAASARYLPGDVSYQQAVWQAYPTPRPTPEPRVDTDTEEMPFPGLKEH